MAMASLTPSLYSRKGASYSSTVTSAATMSSIVPTTNMMNNYGTGDSVPYDYASSPMKTSAHPVDLNLAYGVRFFLLLVQVYS